jgi:conjugative transposon TraK protein
MFQHFKNIDTAFKLIRNFCICFLAACTAIACFAVWKSYESSADFRSHIYVLANGKALEAIASDRKDNIPVELRDHIRTFHEEFFTLDPDDKQIQATVTKALYLADGSAKTAYDNLKEAGYYNNLISGNISQQISVDSTRLDMNQYPYAFTCHATEKLIRSTSVTTRSLVTRGFVRNVSRSDNNPHGFLIERWETLENSDEQVKEGKP